MRPTLTTDLIKKAQNEGAWLKPAKVKGDLIEIAKGQGKFLHPAKIKKVTFPVKEATPNIKVLQNVKDTKVFCGFETAETTATEFKQIKFTDQEAAREPKIILCFLKAEKGSTTKRRSVKFSSIALLTRKQKPFSSKVNPLKFSDHQFHGGDTNKS